MRRALCAIPTQFFRSYLFAYLFWIGIALGCVALVMLHHLVGGAWGFVIRRLLESGSRTFLLLAVLFLPLLFGLPRLYLWAQPASVAADPILQQKQFYLNPQFFILRAILYFGAWISLAYFLNKWSFEQDRTANPSISRRLEALSGPGLVVYGLTVTFASVDWVLSLEPHWFSTIYGMLFMVVEVLAAMAFVIVVCMLFANYEPLSSEISPQGPQRPGQYAADLRDALGLSVFFAIPDCLVRQFAGGDSLVHGTDHRRLGVGCGLLDSLPLRRSLPAAALAGGEAAHSGARRGGSGAAADDPGGSVLARRTGV